MFPTPSLSRRHLLMAGASALLYAPEALAAVSRPDLVIPLAGGVLQIIALSDRAFRVRFAPNGSAQLPPSSILQPGSTNTRPRRVIDGGTTRLVLPHLTCEVDAVGTVRFLDAGNNVILSETIGGRGLKASMLGDEPVYGVEQSFVTPSDEYLYGTGCFQDGMLNLRGLPRRLTQVNTQISLPFVFSSRGYGLLWHNTGMCEFNPPSQQATLRKSTTSATAEAHDVTTTAGNKTLVRRDATFEGQISVPNAGRYAIQLDMGRKMASRYHVEINGQVLVDFANRWLPPTTSLFADLQAGDNAVRVIANDDDAPTILFDAIQDRTVWRSPVADAIDYVVIGGGSADTVFQGYRQLLGATPLMPRWGYGYIHCRERFHSSDEILTTAREFRRRRLPVDLMVQDWQYWGKYGWNAMRFDETYYPDPKALTSELHAMNMRLMLSVWSRIARDTELGQQFSAKGFYIPDTDWVDVFNPAAADFYWKNMDQRLVPLGIDAWWQDATEPENDDLAGRRTFAGAGDRMRLTYPLQVTRTVYQGQRQSKPDRRVMILSRSAFLGEHRYATSTWSGDIGNDWETLKRQIPAGLNMAAAGYPYWTVDAGGFFRPGDSQYTDAAYHERFLRWFQYATFLPLQRVHGNETKTEFWEFGDTVETVARQYLELRYRLHPYIYSTAAEVSRDGGTLLRPLAFDFPTDRQALEQSHAYLFGRAFHIAPVFEPGATHWPVYLPQTAGGWYDFWSDAHRQGGQTYPVETPIDRLPVHIRAGSIVPLGPVIQSTVDRSNTEIELRIYPGQDARFSLYDDSGLDYGYETGQFTRTPITWNDGRRELTIGQRQGRFEGMASRRSFRIRVAGSGQQIDLDYSGRPVSTRFT